MKRDRKSAKELFEELDDTDESEKLEAKSIKYDTARSNSPNSRGGLPE